jgi:hypothetical protein
MSTVDVEVSIQLRGRTKAIPEPAAPRIPRITRLMALAVKFQTMIEQGEVRDYADLARLGYVTRARLTQIMNLLLLAPDIQEQVLLGTPLTGKNERAFRVVCAEAYWPDQRSRIGLWIYAPESAISSGRPILGSPLSSA